MLNNKGKATSQKEVRPIWNNAQRVNHQNKLTHPHPRRNFVPSVVITNSGKVLVNTSKQSFSRAAISNSTARDVNTVASRPTVNGAKPISNVNNVTTVGPKAVVSAAEGYGENTIKSSACWIWRPTRNVIDHISKDSRSYTNKRFYYVDPQGRLKYMIGNKLYLSYYQDINGGFVVFARSPKGDKITGKGKIRTGKLDFKDVYLVKELKFNLFSVSQMCDKKNSVLFIETECLILSPHFKLLNESQILLKVHRQNNIYSFDLKNVVPLGDLTFVTDDYSRFSWVFFFATKNKTSEILKNFITGIENQIYHKVKAIKCDNGTEFKNRIMNEFCEMKGIGREFSVARTPQQNGVAERKNRTLIEVARTMLADSKLPTTFWAEAVNTACYVQNRVLVIKPYNKTPYELFLGRKPTLSFMRPFGCHVTILNNLDHLGKFDGKSDDGFFVGYSINSKAFRVFNTRTKIVEENLHINFLENKPNVARTGPNWLFDIDTLTMSMNYQPIFVRNQTNGHASTKANIDARQAGKKTSSKDEVADDARKKNEVLDPAKEGDMNGQGEAADTNSTNRLNTDAHGNNTYMIFTPVSVAGSFYDNLGGSVSVNVATLPNGDLPTNPLMPELEDIADLQDTGIFSGAYDDEDVGTEANLNNLETTMNVSPLPTTRIYKDHPKN
ncbi:putative ribonuclease H-like domain-containing protein [Tanacetum coccineum]